MRRTAKCETTVNPYCIILKYKPYILFVFEREIPQHSFIY